MADDYRPELADYFDSMEAKYGEGFSFDSLSNEELLTIERLGRHAIEVDDKVTKEEKRALAPLLDLVMSQRTKRGLS